MVREGYKETELGEIPEEWITGPLSEIAYINPKTDTSSFNNLSEIAFLPMENVSESGRIIRNEVRGYLKVKSGYTSFQDGDVIFAKITPCMENGKGALLRGLKNGVGFGSTEFHVLRAKPENDPEFIYHVSISRNFRLISERFFSGSAGQQRVSKDVFFQFAIPLPPLPEQHRIATVLGTIDECIEKTEALIAKLKQVKAGLMQDLLTRGIDDEGRIRDESTHEFKDTEIGRVPVEWEVIPLQSIASVKTGPFGAQLHESDYVDEGTPIITVEHLSDFGIIHQQLPRVSDYDKRRLSQYLLVKGDIVFSRVGSIDRNSLIQEVESGWLFSGRLLRVRPINNTIYTQYLSYFFQLDKFKNSMRNVAVGGIMASINTKILNNVVVPIPSMSEQYHIASILTTVDECTKWEEAYREKLISQKLGLMIDLLTGRVRVKEEIQ